MTASRIYSDIANDISDMITSSWNARQTTYDIISAKQSDAILGYHLPLYIIYRNANNCKGL